MNLKIRIPLLLSVFSVLGLLLYQFLWLGRTYVNTEKNFSDNVYSNLAVCVNNDAVQRLSQGEKKPSFRTASVDYEKKEIAVLYDNEREVVKAYAPSTDISSILNILNHEMTVINLPSLDTIYAASLARFNIQLPFILEVIDTESGAVLSTTFREGDDRRYSFTTRAYPWGMFGTENIRARFVSPYSTFLAEAKSIVAGSLFLAFLLIFTVIFLIRTIIHQKKIEEIRTDFVNVVIHELKNPLLYMSRALENIRMRYPDTTNLLDSISPVDRKVESMNQMVYKLLATNTTDNKLYIIPKEIDLKALLDSILLRYRTDYPSGKLKLKLQYERACDTLIADPLHLENAVVNLIDNAINYTKATPEILIRVYENGGRVYLSVLDNGVGISRKNRKLVFKKYYRIEHSGTAKSYGFGLGLQYVKMVARAHGGDVFVKSELKKGSEFIIFIDKM